MASSSTLYRPINVTHHGPWTLKNKVASQPMWMHSKRKSFGAFTFLRLENPGLGISRYLAEGMSNATYIASSILMPCVLFAMRYAVLGLLANPIPSLARNLLLLVTSKTSKRKNLVLRHQLVVINTLLTNAPLLWCYASLRHPLRWSNCASPLRTRGSIRERQESYAISALASSAWIFQAGVKYYPYRVAGGVWLGKCWSS